jgi:glycosyltransferase involved in cell wall biosynthesis
LKKFKIAVYAISKNEEQFVDRWVDSMQEADEIYVSDTGSTDNTVKKLKDRGVIVNKINIKPWRFDKARNASLNFINKNVDICVCTDLDEILQPGWRKKVEKAWKNNQITRLKYMYTWSFNPDGTPGRHFVYSKIHKRNDYKWTHPVHEILEYTGKDQEEYAFDETIQLDHYPDPTKSRGQYLDLLIMAAKEDPNDDRNMHYLGREYMFYKKWDECIETLNKHLEMPKSTWNDERAASMRYISRAYLNKNNYSEATKWLYRAIIEASHLREPYIEMAQLAYLSKDWAKVYHMVEEALKIKEKSLTYLNEPYSWDHTIYDLGALACYYLGMYSKSYDFALEALKFSDDERLVKNLEIIEKKFKSLK